jgi:hypothetical protein
VHCLLTVLLCSLVNNSADRLRHTQDTYGLEKLYHEQMCLAYAADFPINTRMARFHNVYGPHGTWKVRHSCQWKRVRCWRISSSDMADLRRCGSPDGCWFGITCRTQQPLC